jgi:hypothetical protein
MISDQQLAEFESAVAVANVAIAGFHDGRGHAFRINPETSRWETRRVHTHNARDGQGQEPEGDEDDPCDEDGDSYDPELCRDVENRRRLGTNRRHRTNHGDSTASSGGFTRNVIGNVAPPGYVSPPLVFNGRGEMAARDPDPEMPLVPPAIIGAIANTGAGATDNAREMRRLAAMMP